MSINDISTCLKGGISYGGGREEDASNLLWCEHCGIALCFDCDTNLHNSRNSKYGHLRVLLPASSIESVRKCEHGADGSSNVRLDLTYKPSPLKSKRRSSKKERGSSTTSNSESGRRSSSSRSELLDGESAITSCDVGDNIIKKSETTELLSLAPLPHCEKATSSSLKIRRSALRGGYEEAGLGPRPKQNVTWHPDVIEPTCSIVSHTVGHKRAPAFLSRRSYQKQMRQKNKENKSKTQSRSKKQESKKVKKRSEPGKTRLDVSFDSSENMGSELELSSLTDEDFTNSIWRNCTYCIEEDSLCDCVNMPEGCMDDCYLQSVLLESAVRPESLVNKTVQESKLVEAKDTKSSALATSDDRHNENFPDEYRQLLASMLHAATSLGQNETKASNVKYEAVEGRFRDPEMRAPGANLSGSEEVFKQATQGKISAWISVV